MKGVIVFDVKEKKGTQGKVQLVEGPSSSLANIWVNEVVILDKEHFLVLDKEKNIFVFERNFLPTNEIQKYKLMVIAQINTGEEITSAILGSINMQDNQAIL